MVCLRGESLTTHRNQMKLFKTIAATAAVITCCIGNPLPAEARDGDKLGCTQNQYQLKIDIDESTCIAKLEMRQAQEEFNAYYQAKEKN